MNIKNILKSLYKYCLHFKITKLIMINFKVICKDTIAALRYRTEIKRTPINLNESETFDKTGFLELLDIKFQNIPNLDHIADDCVYSSFWDQSRSTETVLLGRIGGKNLFQQTFILPKDAWVSLLSDADKIRKRLETLKRRKFDLKYVTTYRFFPLEFENFQSFMWHIDFVTYSNHDYKYMLLLNDVSTKNGPMLISDISLNRRFRHNGGYRFSDDYVNKMTKNIHMFTGEKGKGFIFDTKFLHKGGRVIEGVRDVAVFSFNPGSGTSKNAMQIAGPVGENRLLTGDAIIL